MNTSIRRALALEETGPPGGRWRFDKRVSLSLILSVLAHLCTLVYFVGKISVRVDHLEQSNGDIALHLADLDGGRMMVRERLARVETSVADISELLRRMDGKLDRLQEQRGH